MYLLHDKVECKTLDRFVCDFEVAIYQIRFQDTCKDNLRNMAFEGKNCVNDQNENKTYSNEHTAIHCWIMQPLAMIWNVLVLQDVTDQICLIK